MGPLRQTLIGAVALAACAVSADAQVIWSDDFDSYSNGADLEGGVGGWGPWFGFYTGLARVSSIYNDSAPHSAQITP